MKIASAYNGTGAPATAVRNIFDLEKVCGSESEAKPGRGGAGNFPATIYGAKFHSTLEIKPEQEFYQQLRLNAQLKNTKQFTFV